MCAQRKPAVKEAKTPAPAKTAPGNDGADKAKPVKAAAKGAVAEKPKGRFGGRFF